MSQVQIFIAHRGNIDGSNPERENEPSYILEAIEKGFNVEVDVWYKDEEDTWFLGHDEPVYPISFDFLKENASRLWCHAKNIGALSKLGGTDTNIRYFYHDKDEYTLTSSGHIWCYIGAKVTKNSICVMPELAEEPYTFHKPDFVCYGICSDYIANYKRRMTATTKIALILAGRIITWESNLLPQIKQLYDENPNIWIDIYASINDGYEKDTQKATEKDILKYKYYRKFIQQMQPSNIYIKQFICDEKYINWSNINPEYACQRHLLGNFVSQLFNVKNANSMIMENIYDRVVLYRADLMIKENKFPNINDPIEDNCIYARIRKVWDDDFIDNVLIYGNYTVMKKYCNIYELLDKYLNEGMKLHPEFIVTTHVNKEGIHWKKISYDYVIDENRKIPIA